MPTPFDGLRAAGVSVWLDDLSRDRLLSGWLNRSVRAGEIAGITTNPTIFAKAIGQGTGYEAQLRELALRGTAVGEALRLLTAWDVRAACDVLQPVFEQTDRRDGRVSIEVDPRISGDAERTSAEARGLWWLVDRPNLFIKIPATREGLPAITEALADGISVNVTLIFTVDRYREVVDAFLAGLERRFGAGQPIDHIESVASFFISRVDAEVDRRLDELANCDSTAAKKCRELRGRAAIANAALAYAHYEAVLESPRWRSLADQGARMQRLLWASTGVKDPAYRETLYIDELVAADTVNTMPETALSAFGDHGSPTPGGLQAAVGPAQEVVGGLAALGIEMGEVGALLERQGVASFEKSWNELIASVTGQLEKMGAEILANGAVRPASEDGGPSTVPAAGAPILEGEGIPG